MLDEITLSAERIARRVAISKSFAPVVSVSIVEDELAYTTLVMFDTFIYGRDIQRIQYPVDWWQAVKDRWFPMWLKQRFPVRYKVYDVKQLWPDIPDSPDKYGRRFTILKEVA